MQNFLIQNGIVLALVLGCLAIAVAIALALKIRAADTGTALKREIASAIEEGAKAYLSRQIKTISAIAVVLFVLIFIAKGIAVGWASGGATAFGFVIGATC